MHLNDSKDVKKLLHYLRRNGIAFSSSASTYEDRGGAAYSDQTLTAILDSLSGRFQTDVFSTKEAEDFVSNNLKRSRITIHFALRFGITQGRLRRIRRGYYAFQSPMKPAPKYEPDLHSVVDVTCSQVDRLNLTVRAMARVSDTVNLYFGDGGVFARFANLNGDAVMDIHLDKDAFEVFHVRGHAKLTVSCLSLGAILRNETGGPFHLLVRPGERLKAGILGNEHELEPARCDISTEPYPVEQAIVPPEPVASFSLPVAQLRDILRNVRGYSEYARLGCSQDRLTFEPAVDKPPYRKQVLDSEHRVKIDCTAAYSGVFYVPSMMVLLAGSNYHIMAQVKARLSPQTMVIDILNDSGFSARCYIATAEERCSIPRM